MKIKASQLRQVIREMVTEGMVDELDQAVRIKPTADTSRNAAARDFKAAKKGSTASKFYGTQLTANPQKSGVRVHNKDYGGNGEFKGKDKTWSRQDEFAEVDELASVYEDDDMSEDVMPPSMHPNVDRSTKPAAPAPKSGAGGPPNLKAFKADCGMMADAANRVKTILDAGQGNTGEAIRWLDKVVQFATSAKGAIKKS